MPITLPALLLREADMPATISHFVTHEFPTDDADAIALEHIAWAKQAGFKSRDVLASIDCVLRSNGCQANYGRKERGWALVRDKLRLLHICHVQPLLNAQDRKEKAA